MQVVLDASSTLLRSSGVKNFVQFWAGALQQFAGGHSLSFYPFLRELGSLRHEGSNHAYLDTAIRKHLLNFLNIRNNPIINAILNRADLVHASQHMRNFPSRPKVTATLFDMSCWTVPETHELANIQATQDYANQILKRADGIIAISNSARDDAVRILGIPPDRFDVIYPGVSPAFFERDVNAVDLVRQRYGLRGNYVLSLGTVEPRKNLDLLMDAYSSLPESIQEEWLLVFAGPEGWSSPSTLARLRSGRRWRYLGYVPEEDLPALTAGASVFVFPSLYEGFGLPLAQAMAAGVPSITSNLASMPEVAGDGALLIDPHSQREVRDGLMRLMLSPTERTEISRYARARAQRYTWETAARQSWVFFERTCGAMNG